MHGGAWGGLFGADLRSGVGVSGRFVGGSVPGMKNKLLGGEGLFHTVITGPGHVVLQTMPISTIAQSIIPFIPTGK